MEKIDILFTGIVVCVIIFAINIIFINLRLKIIKNIINSQADVIDTLIKCHNDSAALHKAQNKINKAQTEFNKLQNEFNESQIETNKAQEEFNNKIANNLIGTSSTGGRRSEAEA